MRGTIASFSFTKPFSKMFDGRDAQLHFDPCSDDDDNGSSFIVLQCIKCSYRFGLFAICLTKKEDMKNDGISLSWKKDTIHSFCCVLVVFLLTDGRNLFQRTGIASESNDKEVGTGPVSQQKVYLCVFRAVYVGIWRYWGIARKSQNIPFPVPRDQWQPLVFQL